MTIFTVIGEGWVSWGINVAAGVCVFNRRFLCRHLSSASNEIGICALLHVPRSSKNKFKKVMLVICTYNLFNYINYTSPSN